MLNLATLLESSARDFPTRDAVVLGPTHLTYAQVNGAASQVANALLERGLQPGDKVALTCPNVPYFPIVYYGILKAGGVVVPLNVLLKNREIAYHLRDSDARFYFCFQGTPELPMGLEGYAGFTEVDSCEHFVMITADPVAPSPVDGTTTLGQVMAAQSPVLDAASTDASDTAVILYTSGTTGQPKGAELSHANLVMNTVVCEKLFGAPPAGTHDVHLVALPLFHSFGQSVQMNTGFSMGATLVLLPRFDPVEALLTMDRENRWQAPCAWPRPAAPRCRSRSSPPSPRGSGCRSSRATASRRPVPWPASAAPTSRRARAPSESRCGACR